MIFGRNLDRVHLAIAGIVTAAVFLLALNVVSTGVFRGAAVDFTDGRLYTLSDGTREVLADIREPITLRLFYSPQLGDAFPSYSAYAARVRELLERYKDLANGKIRLEIYSPEPFSDDEDQAVGFGMNGITVNAEGDTVYLGLAGSNSTDDEKVIPFLHFDRERFLEYDLTRMVADLANPEKKVVGLISSLPLAGMRGNPMMGPAGGGQPPWLILQEIRQQFEVRNVDPEAGAIDKDVDVLMVVHPKGLSDAAFYAIDQYVLRGGRALILVDPHAEGQRPGSPMMQMPGETSSDFDKLFEAWGVQVEPDKIVGDKNAAIRVTMPSRTGRGQEVVQYLAWLSLDDTNIDAEDVITADLSRMIMASAGAIRRRGDTTVEIRPLVFSSKEAMEIDTARIRFVPDPAGLWTDFEPTGEIFVLAARLSGKAKSAFPDGPPEAKKSEDEKPEDEKKDGDETAGGEEPGPPMPDHIAESAAPINVILIADTDFMRDQFWVQVRDFFGQPVAVRTSGNADFVINAIENLTGGEALISLRSRGDSVRPFGLVQRIQQDAEDRFRRREQELESKLSETEKKLSELQTGKGQDGGFILTAEQEQAIEDFRGEMVAIRKDLRDVQLALRRDIDRLDAWLKFINIGLIPLLIGVVAVALSVVRQGRRRRAVRAAA